MELGVVVTHVLFDRCPINEEVFLFVSISNSIKRMSMVLDLRCLTVSSMIPESVELPVCMGIGPCGYSISSSEVLSNSTSLSLINRPPNSASAAEAITFFRMAATTNISPLCLVCDVGLNLSLRKKSPPTLILALDYDR